MERKNRNRGYQQLRVWQEAIDIYGSVCDVFRGFPFELKKIASQEIASVDSIHRNIAEGYCRRSVREYIHFLYTALSSLGESVSGLRACLKAGQISEADFETLDQAAFKLENGLLKLVESLEKKRDRGEWTDNLSVNEDPEAYNP